MMVQPLLTDLQVFPDRVSKQEHDPCLSFDSISDWVNELPEVSVITTCDPLQIVQHLVKTCVQHFDR